MPRELGGMNCPLLLYMINSEMMGRADVSVMAHHGFHGGGKARVFVREHVAKGGVLEGGERLHRHGAPGDCRAG